MSGITEKNHEKLRSGWPVSWLDFQLWKPMN